MTPDGEPERVLVLVQGDRDRELLTRRLEGQYEVVFPSDGSLPEAFDCCIVDDQSLPDARQALGRRRAATEPVARPVLLLVRASDRGPDPWLRFRDDIGDVVDDVATMPLGEGELRVRLSSMLRTRRFSRALEERRDELELYRRAMDEADIGIVITDAAGDQPIRYANEGFERITGYDREAAVGRNCRFLQDEGTDPDQVAEMRRAVEAAEPTTVVVRNYRADRTPFWNEVGIVPVRDDAGTVTHYLGFQRDVTDRVERETEIERQRTRLSLALEAAGAGVWELDPATDEVIWDDRTQELHGFAAGEFDGTYESAVERIHPDDLPVIEDRIETALGTGGSYEVEYRVDHPSDTVVWIVSHGTVLLDEDGDPERVTGVVRDVTQRVERERQLERTVDLYDRTQAIADVGGWEVDLETGEILWTDQVYEILEVPRGPEPSLEEALAFYVDGDRETVAEAIEDAAATGGSFDLEVQVDTAGGDRKWVRVRGDAAERDDREPLVRGTFQDVTDRKTHELTLERFERIVQTAEDPIFATDAEGRFTLVNDAMVALTGRSRMDLIGREARGNVWAEEGYDHEAMVADLLDGETVTVSTWAEVASGPVREFEVSLSPLFDDGEYSGAVGVARDVTDVRERERRLSVLDRVLRHNLRNKLNLVLAHADVLAEETTDPDLRERAATILDVSEELLSLSQDVRDFQGAIDPDRGTIGRVDLASRVARAIDDTESAHPEARITASLPDSAPVRAHETIELAIEELLENAVIHAGVQNPTVAVSLSCEDGTCELRIADEGPGIGRVERAALTRGEETPLQHSTGLGLWLVRWTVSSSGGRLDIRDRDGRGTEIVVALPEADDQQLPAGAE